MQISSQYHSVSLLNNTNGVDKTSKKDGNTSVEAIAVPPETNEEKNPVGVYFNSWSQSDKDIFNKLTENMSGLDKSSSMISLYFYASARVNGQQSITVDDISVSDMLSGTIQSLKSLQGGVNTAETISFLEDFIKLRESGYTSVDTMA